MLLMQIDKALSLKDAATLVKGLPSLITLKRWSAAGKLDSALAGESTGRYKARLYDPQKLVAICANAARDNRVDEPHLDLESLSRPPSLPSSTAIPDDRPTTILSSGPDDIADLHSVIAILQQQIEDMRPLLSDLAATKRALQMKYDAENQLLRQQRDTLLTEVAAMRGKDANLDLARVQSQLSQIASKLGA